MAETTTRKELIVYAVTLLLKAVLLAAAWAGKARRKGLESIAEMSADEKNKEIVFLRDQVHQLKTQVEILKKRCHVSSKKHRHTLKERLFNPLAYGVLPDSAQPCQQIFRHLYFDPHAVPKLIHL